LLLIVIRERPTSTGFHQTPPGPSSLLQVSTHSEEVQGSTFIVNVVAAWKQVSQHREFLLTVIAVLAAAALTRKHAKGDVV
jgi:hypothetical protein